MRTVLKRTVPLLLAILILGSISWYLLTYDRNFTRDLMLSAARISNRNGNSSAASWFYDRAYSFSGKDETAAIELANQFKAEGNYTKAEYTLSTAISKGANANLYIALCKTYIEQDKLLDAVTMLDSITDASVKAQLDAMRPKAPEASPEPGFYSQFIPVSLSGDTDRLYFTTTGEYPTIHSDPYSEPIVLPGGTTNIYAVSVGENGLVSPVSVFAYTVGGVILPVEFSDQAIEASIRDILGISEGKTIYTNDLWGITEFTVPDDAEDLSDLSLLIYLRKLTIANKKIESLSFLPSLSQLEEIYMVGCKFPSEDQALIAALPALKKLTMASCSISTIANLENTPTLTYLDLSGNTIRNLSPISGMTGLKTLNLQHNAVIALDDLAGLTELTELDLSYNSITGIAPLAECTKLSRLNLSCNSLTSLTALDKMLELEFLSLDHNKLEDVSLVSKCVNLRELHIAYNKIQNIASLSTLVLLEQFDFSHNEVTQIPYWGNGGALRILEGSYNNVTNIDTLWNMSKLTYVYMDYNKIVSLSYLAGCPNLVQINVYGNPLVDISGLDSKSIIVNYDPTK